MLGPMACVWSRKTKPSVFSISPKYSFGLTRTSAPVGQFSSHEYAGRDAPAGFSDVVSQRLHLIATISSPLAVGGTAAGALELKKSVIRSIVVSAPAASAARGSIA